ncbi:MAG TPA: hypothetical protein VNH17_01975, partial [Streptosporangiaceae bacterium]|nr:hypothetical protein [Streptosporangiaceae bacterium]
MPEPDIFEQTAAPPPPSRHGSKRFGRMRSLSARTPLRTKLITALLGLVIIAIAAISVASTYMLRSYLVTQHDNELRQQVDSIQIWGGHTVGYATYIPSGKLIGIQKPGQPLTWPHYGPGQGYGQGPGLNQGPLPALPLSHNWASSTRWDLVTLPSQSGADTWRVIASTQQEPVVNGAGVQTTE